MFTNLKPNYEFTDGTGFIVGTSKGVRDGDKVKVFIPSLMSEISRANMEEENIESIVSRYNLFANPESCPNIPEIVISINYISVELTSGAVLSKANKTLSSQNAATAKPITHIPSHTNLLPGEQIQVYSNTGTIKDIYIG